MSRVSKLDQLLTYLDRNDVRAIIFRSGNPVKLQTHTRVVPVTSAPLSAPQIHRFFNGTELAERFPEYDEEEITREADLCGRRVSVSVAQLAGILEVRVESPASRDRRTPHQPQHPTRDIPARGSRVVRRVQATADTVQAAAVTLSSLPRAPTARSGSLEAQSPSESVDESRTLPVIEPERARESRTALEQCLAASPDATDIHFMSDDAPRYRRASVLRSDGSAISAETLESMIAPILARRDQQQLAERGYCDFAVDLATAGRFRVNVCRQRTGLKACFRRIVRVPPTPAELGLPEEVAKLERQHQGLVVISGPNGHGKTTTMAALVDLFNRNHAMHIITVEDPVEVLHPRKKALITQREVGTHTESFHAALAGALREDPDVIVIGELRDRETVEMALAASETGHLVLATMSTPSAAKTIDRMIDLFPPDDQSQVRATMAGSLKLVLSQRLLRRADGNGLVAAYEMATGAVPLWTLIRDNKLYQLPSLLQRGRSYGMIRLEDSLRVLIERNVISEEEAMLYASDRNLLKRRPDAGAAKGS